MSFIGGFTGIRILGGCPLLVVSLESGYWEGVLYWWFHWNQDIGRVSFIGGFTGIRILRVSFIGVFTGIRILRGCPLLVVSAVTLSRGIFLPAG